MASYPYSLAGIRDYVDYGFTETASEARKIRNRLSREKMNSNDLKNVMQDPKLNENIDHQLRRYDATQSAISVPKYKPIYDMQFWDQKATDYRYLLVIVILFIILIMYKIFMNKSKNRN